MVEFHSLFLLSENLIPILRREWVGNGFFSWQDVKSRRLWEVLGTHTVATVDPRNLWNPERWQVALPDIQTFVHLCPLESAMSQNNSLWIFMVWICLNNMQYIAVLHFGHHWPSSTGISWTYAKDPIGSSRPIQGPSSAAQIGAPRHSLPLYSISQVLTIGECSWKEPVKQRSEGHPGIEMKHYGVG